MGLHLNKNKHKVLRIGDNKEAGTKLHVYIHIWWNGICRGREDNMSGNNGGSKCEQEEETDVRLSKVDSPAQWGI